MAQKSQTPHLGSLSQDFQLFVFDFPGSSHASKRVGADSSSRSQWKSALVLLEETTEFKSKETKKPLCKHLIVDHRNKHAPVLNLPAHLSQPLEWKMRYSHHLLAQSCEQAFINCYEARGQDHYSSTCRRKRFTAHNCKSSIAMKRLITSVSAFSPNPVRRCRSYPTDADIKHVC